MPAKVGVLTLSSSRMAKGLQSLSVSQNSSRTAGTLDESALPQDPGRLGSPRNSA